MAMVWLDRRDGEEGNLPAVCLRCGQPATVWVDKTFRWVPAWVSALVLLGSMALITMPIVLILLFGLMQSCRVSVPLCAEHRRHWSGRNLMVLGSLFGLMGVVAVIMGLGWAVPDQQEELLRAGAIMGIIGFVVWLVVAALIHSGTIRAVELGAESLQLCKVARAFVDAYEDERYERRRARRRARERDEGEERDERRDGYREG
jgi:hypothetical protein